MKPSLSAVKHIMNNPGEVAEKLVRSISQVLIGKDAQIKQVVVALLARGHVLIEDVPGVGKTLLALATARSMGVRFKRVQFTSDTLPSDVIGVSVFNPKDSTFEFNHGPVFTEVLLADEINRTSPRTQSALFEAMSEGHVSVDGSTYTLPTPFLVLATMNPVERFGSFELPESQLDRFMMSVSLGYPDRDHEREIFLQDMEHSRADQLEPVADAQTIQTLQALVREVQIESSVMEYLLDLVRATRENPRIRLGISSRGGLHLRRAMQAMAVLDGRDYVIPGDLRAVFLPATLHRVLIASHPGEGQERERKREILTQVLRSIEAPV
jgi:MoxR-like ATPase